MIEARCAEEEQWRMSGFARDLVSQGVDIILPTTTPATLAATEATRTIPIVMVGTLDAQLSGIVQDLARSGGNITCLTLISVQLAGNRLSLPEEAVPAATRLRFLTTWTATGTPMARTLDRVTRAMETGAQRVGMELRMIAAFGADQIKASFAITTCCDAPVACCGTNFRGGPERLVTEKLGGQGQRQVMAYSVENSFPEPPREIPGA